jgi:hypothetical protein
VAERPVLFEAAEVPEDRHVAREQVGLAPEMGQRRISAV